VASAIRQKADAAGPTSPAAAVTAASPMDSTPQTARPKPGDIDMEAG